MGCFVKDQFMRFGYFLTPKSGHAGWSSHFRALEMPYTKLELFILTSIFFIRKAISKWQLGVYNNDNDDVDDKGEIKLGVD